MTSLFKNSPAHNPGNTNNQSLAAINKHKSWFFVILIAVSVFSQTSSAELKQIKKESHYSDQHSKNYASHNKRSNIKSLKASKPENHHGNGWSNNRGTRSSYNRQLNHSGYHRNYSNNYNNRSSYNNRSNYSHRSNYRARQHYYRYGHQVSYLPNGFRRLRYTHYPLYYHGGNYYRSTSRGYLVVRAPLGVHVSHLPIGYATVVIGASTYYVAHDIYYKKHGTDYVVVEPPQNSGVTTVATNEDYNREWLIYPAEGQNDKELERDRYQCHRWAVDQSNYDPSRSKNQHTKRDDYYRAQSACLEGRGYVVK